MTIFTLIHGNISYKLFMNIDECELNERVLEQYIQNHD